jgi:hypothetical protein
MGKFKRAQLHSQRNQEVKERFVDFLAKTGNRAAGEYAAGIPADDILDAMKYAMANFGKPDTLIMDPATMKAFQKYLGDQK